MKRILLYADVDLNLIDGSSIWLVSLVQVLAGSPAVRVTVLQRTPLTRHVVIREARGNPRVQFVDPWSWTSSDPAFAAAMGSHPGRTLHPAAAAALMAELDRRERHGLAIVRSVPVARELTRWPELARRAWIYATDPAMYREEADRDRLKETLASCGGLLCQTEEARAAFRTVLGCADEQLLVLPPMVPEISRSLPRLDPDRPRLAYSGKFSARYRVLEMLDAFDRVRDRRPEAIFHVIGDKFHVEPSIPGFRTELKTRLTRTPGVVWHRGVSRSETTAILRQVHVGASWRDDSFDDSVEISTKVLEYASLGLPVLLNPTPIQRGLMGDDYPCYVETEDDFVERFLEISSSRERYAKIAGRVRDIAAQFTFGRARERLAPLLEPRRAAARRR